MYVAAAPGGSLEASIHEAFNSTVRTLASGKEAPWPANVVMSFRSDWVVGKCDGFGLMPPELVPARNQA
jgi:hypothetical protein